MIYALQYLNKIIMHRYRSKSILFKKKDYKFLTRKGIQKLGLVREINEGLKREFWWGTDVHDLQLKWKEKMNEIVIGVIEYIEAIKIYCFIQSL